MNFVSTKTFSVQAMLRTATLTVLGAGALLVPAHAGLLYNENFNQVTLNVTPTTSGLTDQVGNVNWSYVSNPASATLTANGGPNFSLTNTGWSETTNQNSGAPTQTGDVLVDLYSGGSYTPPSPNTNGNAASSACTSVNCGLLLNTSLGGAITTSVNLAAGTDILTVAFWSDDNVNTASRNTINFNVIINGTSYSVSQNYTGGTSAAFTVPITFAAVAGANTITIRDTNSDGQTPALVVGDVQIATAPEPASALFLLIPAAGLAIRRRMAKK